MLIKRLIAPLFLCVALSGHAQDSLLLRNYEFVKQSDLWLTSSNAAGLTRLNAKNIAQAELSAGYATGGLTTFGGATNVVEAGAGIESLYRINRRVVVHGAIRYDNWTGRHMAGSAFMSERLPFDIVEQTDDNTGRKHRDTYRLTGGVGADLWRGYSIGAKLNYTAANYAKYKDLRHKNKLMDLTLSVGALAPVADWLTVGANYQYHRTTESVTFGTYGKNDGRVYKSIIAYGAFMGRSEQFGNTGYTDYSREMPLVEDQNGGSLQLDVQPFRHAAAWLRPLAIHADVTLAHGRGYYGRKSPYTITYTNHERDITALSGRLSYNHATTRHYLDFGYSTEKLKNYVENYRELTNDAGSYYYQYYDPTEAADKRWDNLSADYTLHLGIRGEHPTWTIRAGYHREERKLTAFLYPFYRYQKLTTNEVTASVERNFFGRHGRWTAALNGGYRKGSGAPFSDGTFATPSARQTAPATMATYLYEEYHLLTSPQYAVGAAAKYAFILPAVKLPTYVRADVQYQRATSQPYDCCGRERTEATLALGCTF